MINVVNKVKICVCFVQYSSVIKLIYSKKLVSIKVKKQSNIINRNVIITVTVSLTVTITVAVTVALIVTTTVTVTITAIVTVKA